MHVESATTIVNQLLAILIRSFPMYLTYAPPWSRSSHVEADEVFCHVVADQQRMAGRLAEFLQKSDTLFDKGEFPMEFTDMHDLSLDFIVARAVDYQRSDIEFIERCVDRVRFSPTVLVLVEEVLGMAKGHLESLEELAVSVVG